MTGGARESGREVTVVILTFNSERWIAPLLESLLDLAAPPLPKIIVVDNASTDATLELLRARGAALEVIRNPRNLGFAAGCNIGIRRALEGGARYVALINPDVRVAPDWLDRLLEGVDDRDAAAVYSPLHLRYDGSGPDPEMWEGILCRVSDFVNDLWKRELKRSYRIPCVYGGAMVFHRDFFARVGYFDELFFLYGEDEDLCRRARRSGIPIILVPASHIFHWHTQAQARGSSDFQPISHHLRRSRIMLALKNPERRWSGRLISVLLDQAKLVGKSVILGRMAPAGAALRDLVWTLATAPAVRRSRIADSKRTTGGEAGTSAAGEGH